MARVNLLRLSMLLFASVLCPTEGLDIGFSEVDYSRFESQSPLSVVVMKTGTNEGNISVRVRTLTYDQFLSEGFSLPDASDPAELNDVVTGRSDFMNTEKVITFTGPDSTSQDQTVTIDLVDDAIDEAMESFVAILEVVDMTSPTDEVELNVFRNVTICIIADDDVIQLTFQRGEYTFSESAGIVGNTVFVVKEDGGLSEQVITVRVGDADDTTEPGEYELISGDTYTFDPTEQMLPVTLQIFDDAVPEEAEQFVLFLTIPTSNPQNSYVLGSFTTANIIIEDNDEVVIGLQRTAYGASENTSVEVCAIVFSPPTTIDLFILISLSTSDGSAIENVDYVPDTQPQFVVLFNNQRRVCRSFSILSDELTEGTENFMVHLTNDPPIPLVTVDPADAVVYIADPAPPMISASLVPTIIIATTTTTATTTILSTTTTTATTTILSTITATPAPTTEIQTSQQCPDDDDDDDVSLAIGLTFLCTFLVCSLPCLISLCIICCCFCLVCRKKKKKDQAVQVPDLEQNGDLEQNCEFEQNGESEQKGEFEQNGEFKYELDSKL